MAKRKKESESDAMEIFEGVDFQLPELSMQNKKQEMLDAYNEAIERFREYIASESKTQRVSEKRQEAKVVEKAKTTKVEGILQSISTVKLEATRHLDQLTEKLVAQAEKLQQIEQAIAVESARLAELHDIEVGADTLANLVQQYDQIEAEFYERLEAKQEEVQQALDQAKAEWQEEVLEAREEFEAEMLEQRQAWEREKALYEETRQQEQGRLERERQREQDEYKYRLQLERSRDADAYQAQQEALQKELEEKRSTVLRELEEQRTTQEQALEAREKAVQARETELQEFKKRVESFPEELKQAVEEARKVSRLETEREIKFEYDLKEKEMQGERELYKLRLSMLEAKIQEQAAYMRELQSQLQEATGKVQDIAMQALGGATRGPRNSHPTTPPPTAPSTTPPESKA